MMFNTYQHPLRRFAAFAVAATLLTACGSSDTESGEASGEQPAAPAATDPDVKDPVPESGDDCYVVAKHSDLFSTTPFSCASSFPDLVTQDECFDIYVPWKAWRDEVGAKYGWNSPVIGASACGVDQRVRDQAARDSASE